MHKALLATDASAASLRAAKVLGEYAGYHAGLRVVVLHVVPLPEVLTPAAAAGAPLTVPGRLEDYLKSRMEDVLHETVAALGLPPEQVETTHVIGIPAAAILSEAQERQCDLIVMGRRGLSPLKEFFLGSVSQEVLHKATCPVFIVP